MSIKGIQKTSLVDFPGKISTVLFFSGCNFKCRYCHNPGLVFNNENQSYTYQYVLDFLKARASLIDGVVITGGEPTLHKNIPVFLSDIKKIPLSVKFDTNGNNPAFVSNLLKKNLINYIAIDIKTSPDKYKSLAGPNADFNKTMETLDLVKKSGIDYELRTTCVPGFLDISDIEKIRSETGRVKKYYLQQFVNKNTLDPEMENVAPYSASVFEEYKECIKSFSEICEIRGI